MRTAVVAVVVLALAACGGSDSGPPDDGWRGAVLTEPLQVPDVRLTDTAGHPFDLRDATAGRVTLLFFGFTNCPDICPFTMGAIARAVDQLPADDAAAVDVVFVGVDPARDTPERLRTFLDAFDERFIGVTGPKEVTDRAQEALGLPPTIIDEPDAAGEYQVGHPAQVTAFGPDGRSWVVYTAGASAVDFEADLHRLVAGEVPAA